MDDIEIRFSNTIDVYNLKTVFLSVLNAEIASLSKSPTTATYDNPAVRSASQILRAHEYSEPQLESICL
jgi:hypothetical protein